MNSLGERSQVLTVGGPFIRPVAQHSEIANGRTNYRSDCQSVKGCHKFVSYLFFTC